MGDLFGGAPVQQQTTDIFGGAPSSAPVADPFGGQNSLMGAVSSAPAFPAYIAYEDQVLAIGFAFQRDLSAANTHTITAHFKNKSGSNLTGVAMQAAA